MRGDRGIPPRIACVLVPAPRVSAVRKCVSSSVLRKCLFLGAAACILQAAAFAAAQARASASLPMHAYIQAADLRSEPISISAGWF